MQAMDVFAFPSLYEGLPVTMVEAQASGLPCIISDKVPPECILTEGLVLQEKTIWKNFLERDIISESNSCELYFEEKNIEAFVEKLDKLYPDIKYVNRLMTHRWGQKIVRFYDLDGNLIEVGTPM